MQSLLITFVCLALALLSDNANSSESATSPSLASIQQSSLGHAPSEAHATTTTPLKAQAATKPAIQATTPKASTSGISSMLAISNYGIAGAALLLLMILTRHVRIHHPRSRQHA